MAKIEAIEGIGEVYGAKLRSADVNTTAALLKRCATARDRKTLAEETGIDPTYILEWANHADLFRIKGVGEEYSDLLEASGVDTVPELAQRNADNLYQKLLEVNDEKELVRRLPPRKAVHDWVAQAKDLPRALHY
jgi:predicted flap endonuclease-1-like 5' DNA nuclease